MLSGCESVDVAMGEILYTPGKRLSHVFFPTTAIISRIVAIDDGDGAGIALRMDAERFCFELASTPALQRQINRYAYVYLTQVSQSAGCTRFHVVESRLARWLLMTQDRARADTFHITQEFLAFMLGVRRVGVTRAASALQHRGLIRYRRGDITVLDRRGLKTAACACYKADRQIYDRFLGLPRPARVSATA
jgi:hypothetical protein